jgi:hypothetical protein
MTERDVDERARILGAAGGDRHGWRSSSRCASPAWSGGEPAG